MSLDALALLANAWTAFSPLAAIVGLSGVGMLVVAIVGLSWLPGVLKRPLILVGAVLLAGAALWQAAEAKGAQEAFARDVARALAAETKRAVKAEAIVAADRSRAAQDLAAAHADAAKLKDLLDALRTDPHRDRVCVDRDLSRRLRAL